MDDAASCGESVHSLLLMLILHASIDHWPAEISRVDSDDVTPGEGLQFAQSST